MTSPERPLCLVTGATGYVGGRLVPELLAAGYRVRCLVRGSRRLRDHPWAGDVEVVEGDASDQAALDIAMRDVSVAYYLIHALGVSSFETRDRETAEAFVAAAERASIDRLVYLGGLTPSDAGLSPHLRSRAEVGQLMLGSAVPAAVLQAAVIIGSGSASFEMLRYLTERLPVMITPRWVSNRIQPIAIRDVLRYLVGVARLPSDVDRAFDIGGPDVLSYAEMMQAYATAAGLPRRRIIPVPVFSPTLSSHWVGVVTPVPGSLARPLVESLRHEVICTEHDIAHWVPDPPEGLLTLDAALRLAIRRVGDGDVATRWSSAALPGAPSDPLPTDPDWAGGSLYEDRRERVVDAEPEDLWTVIESIGGKNGWYSFPLAWSVRGLLDRAVGGVGLRRGRRDPETLYVGESLDFWRVEERIPGELLRLRAEMRLPGLAWLDLAVSTNPTTYAQRALFHPRGLAGHLYWWSVAPFHGIVFGSMARNIARAAEQRTLSRRGQRPASPVDAETVRTSPS